MRQRTVLLIAHNPQEIQLIRQTLAQTDTCNTLQVVYDEEEALAYLRCDRVSTNPHHVAPADVIVLDLPHPHLVGQEVVQRLKQDARFKRLPIIVLVPFGEIVDVHGVYAAGANACLQKPLEMARFIDVIRQLEHFWLETVELPSQC